ncbi:NAD-dependent epimerase/dehydratase family protein [Nitriliruptor alkaliphilus]|uniref:NAD-dependent epimerase/dehydratase family protein n=1 Tax=Nitriliruptor alkaliphilus TaxID=427918 RepID=UPI00069924EE|nr:NAD-dependent epimerase/dehydratase family protein [Nitriliruptor alkaliphilus]
MHVTVLGATGGIGRATTLELAARGHAVTAVSRSITPAHVPSDVRALAADLTDPVAARAACAGSDVVVMAASLPYAAWANHLQPMVTTALDAAAAADARFVMVDNLYGYGTPDTPITDASPEVGTTRKAAVRRDLGRSLLAAHAAGHARVTIGRFSDYYGVHGQNSLVNMLGVDRVLAGKRPQAFIDADQPHTFAYLPDAARAVATLVERPEADGRSWILPAAEPRTQRAILTLVCEAAGRPARIGRITPGMLWVAGLVDTQLREAREQVAQFDRPYVALGRDFEATFGPLRTTPHEVAVAETVAGRRVARSSGAPLAA